jgi:hypothetical protein
MDNDELQRRMSQAPGAIMRQSTLCVTFTGVLIGFLLSISISSLSTISLANLITLIAAIFAATVAINLFIMPSIFYHLPSRLINLELYERSSQKFILFGIIAVSITLYLCLEVSLSALLSIETAFGVAAVPFALVYSMFLVEVRKNQALKKRRQKLT